MVKDFLKLSRGFGSPALGQRRLPSHVNDIVGEVHSPKLVAGRRCPLTPRAMSRSLETSRSPEKLTKGSGSFKIDHPLDPAKKYLSHSFVESPDMMNVYNGNVTTDRHGFAIVTLPSYFEALNRDFRYQLTVIGQFAQAIVAEEISHNLSPSRPTGPA